jgi:hypothetical protein
MLTMSQLKPRQACEPTVSWEKGTLFKIGLSKAIKDAC